MTTIDTGLRLAITKKRLVKLSYSGSVRVVEPHDYGVQKGAVRLLAYQQQSFGPRKSERLDVKPLLEMRRAAES